MLGILDQIIAVLNTGAAQAGVVAVVLEIVLRLIPSKAPLSILHVAAVVLKKVGAICLAAGGLLDKVLPQKLV